MQIIHCHIATEAPPLNPKKVPRVIGDVINKLMKKDASERYQSCQGLIHDLQKCQQLIQTDANNQDHIEWFCIGHLDYAERFGISTRLYGREQQVSLLVSVFDRVAARGTTEVVLVSGSSGIGKSSLVRELQRSAQLKEGYFASGKYDQLERNSLYGAIVEAMRMVVKQVLGEGEQRLVYWKKTILDAVGIYGQLIIDLVPELHQVIGDQPPVLKVAPAEAKGRLESTLVHFIQAFVQQGRPMVIFIDDIQWADRESTRVMLALIVNVSNMLFIGAYRDNEVGPEHSTFKMIEQMRESTTVTDLVLSPLQRDTVRLWVHDTLNDDSNARDNRRQQSSKGLESLMELSDMIYQKTEGNPFFVHLFMRTIYFEKLLYREGKPPVWKWDIDKIRAQKATENVVTLMSHRVSQFSKETERVLKWASCMGNSFDVRVLAYAMNSTLEQVQEELYEVMNAGMMVNVEDRLQFAHDRVQEAAYGLTSTQERVYIHYSIGRKWQQLQNNNTLNSSQSIVKNDALFDITDHLNKGRSILFDTNQQSIDHVRSLCDQSIETQLIEMSQLNMQVGRKSMEVASYGSSIKYLSEGITCLELSCPDEDTRWERHHDLMFMLHIEIGTAYFSTSDYEKMQTIMNILHKKNKSRRELAMIYRVELMKCITLMSPETIDIGRTLVKLYNIDIVESDPVIANENFRQNQKLIDMRLDELRDSNGKIDILPLVKYTVDLETEIVYFALVTMLLKSYLSDQAVFPAVASTALIVMLNKCITGETAGVMVYYAITQASAGRYDITRNLSDLVILLTENVFPDRISENVRTLHLYNYFLRCYYFSLRYGLENARELYTLGMSSGEIFYGVLSHTFRQPSLIYVGENLSSAAREIKQGQEMAKKFSNMTLLDVSSLSLAVCDVMQGIVPVKNFYQYMDDVINNKSSTCTATMSMIIREMLQCHLFDDYQQDVDQCTKSPGEFSSRYMDAIYTIEQNQPYIAVMYMETYHFFYGSLLMIRVIREIDNCPYVDQSDLRREILDRIAKYLSTLQSHCEQYEANFKSKILLIQAEMTAHVDNQLWNSIGIYEESIQECKKHGFVHEEALALELQAKSLFKANADRIAMDSLRQSYNAYSKWGAHSKNEMMKIKYKQLCDMVDHQDSNDSSQSKSAMTNTMNVELASYDIRNVLSAAQLISSDIDEEKLITNVTNIIVRTANASKGAIIVNGMVCCSSGTNQCYHIPLEEWKDGCVEVIKYAIENKRIIVCKCAYEDSQYSFIRNDPYIQSNNIKSMMCMPVISRNKVQAVLYVENNLVRNCFKKEVDVMGVLASQVAISLENARSVQTQMAAVREHAEATKEKELMYYRQQEEFVDRICHEIRNPIQGFLGTCEIMTDVLDKMEKEQSFNPNHLQTLLEGVRSIRTCGKYQKVITDDVLLLSKLECKQLKLNYAPMSIDMLLQHVIRMFESSAVQKNLYLTYQLQQHVVDLIVNADYNRILQVLTNLVSNAIKFTEKGGITITAKVQLKNTVHIEFCVSDTGVGVEIENRSIIFDRFAQATQRSIVEYSGSGLGLFISKMLCELMNGNIWIESNPVGRGSNFYFALECEQVMDKDANVVRGNNVVSNHKRKSDKKPSRELEVLVVEDNLINQKVIAKMLTMKSCLVEVAGDGVEALEKYNKRSAPYGAIFYGYFDAKDGRIGVHQTD
ncbi:hybrid signal transduction histidine kinase dhkK [Acrasis kona]|uniref:Hybrid signal transduction histidine kinase dhkK n=1 Tax=Acrasis kona TaxID=1008807 RepID=A0AAW2YI80_9EUKA